MKHKLPHKYIRKIFGKSKYIVYACVLPDCPHYIRRELATNKVTLCWGCNEPFKMGPDITARKGKEKPRCKDCRKNVGFARKTKRSPREQFIEKVLEKPVKNVQSRDDNSRIQFEDLLPKMPKL